MVGALMYFKFTYSRSSILLTDAGYYMYLESSTPTNVNDTAVLQYKTLPTGQPFCLKFWYHMYGSTMGSLRVLAKVSITK